MGLQIVGAGLGRTGTNSLKLALERLLGGPCYHMIEVMGHPDHVPAWVSAVDGLMPDWHALFSDYRAAVDWPAAAFWPELMDAFPDAPVLLSVRDADAWWKSAHATIFAPELLPLMKDSPVGALVGPRLTRRFTPDLTDRAACIAAYERHNAEVRRRVPAGRLVEWRPEQGWGPLCAALHVPVPDEPFPRVNTTEEFQAQFASPPPFAKGH